jgi:hypothetical protein
VALGRVDEVVAEPVADPQAVLAAVGWNEVGCLHEKPKLFRLRWASSKNSCLGGVTGVVYYVVLSSPPTTEETEAMGREIEYCQGVRW